MSCDAAAVCLLAEYAIELGEQLAFLGDWLGEGSRVLSDALAGVCGGGYSAEDLWVGLARLALLLGGDGERFVFGDYR